MRIIANSVLSVWILSAAVMGHAQAPDNSFRQASGQMYCQAPHGGQGCHARGRLTVSIEPGYVIDRSYHQGSIPCCGGEENGNGASTEIPGGAFGGKGPILYPPIPELPVVGTKLSEAQIFWVAKHGIRRSGMFANEAWASDEKLWTLATYIKRMNSLPPDVRGPIERLDKEP